MEGSATIHGLIGVNGLRGLALGLAFVLRQGCVPFLLSAKASSKQEPK